MMQWVKGPASVTQAATAAWVQYKKKGLGGGRNNLGKKGKGPPLHCLFKVSSFPLQLYVSFFISASYSLIYLANKKIKKGHTSSQLNSVTYH